MESDTTAFWRTKTLEQLTPQEWESLCDGCARCCLLKLEDEDTGDIYLTKLTCSLLDPGKCQCSDYENRQARMPDCVSIDPQKVKELAWLPKSCAYRKVSEGRDLSWWHHLVSGSRETVHEAGMSVRSWARSETGISADSIDRYIIDDFKDD